MSLSDRLNNIQSNISTDGVSRAFQMASMLGAAGAITGLYIAWRRHSRAWGYVGYGFFGALIGSTLGNVAGMVITKDTSPQPSPKEREQQPVTTPHPDMGNE